jgi:hypothetical protein
MSTNNQRSRAPTSNFTSIFQNACIEYKKLTGHDLATHPFAKEFDRCNSPEGFLDVFREQTRALTRSRKDDEKILAWLNPIVNILCNFSATLGEGIGLVSISSPPHRKTLKSVPQPCPPAKTIFTGIGVLLTVGLPHSLMFIFLIFDPVVEGCCHKLFKTYPPLRAYPPFPRASKMLQ